MSERVNRTDYTIPAAVFPENVGCILNLRVNTLSAGYAFVSIKTHNLLRISKSAEVL